MKAWNPLDYGPAAAALLEQASSGALDAGRPHDSARAAIGSLDADSIVAPRRLVNRPMALCCLAGLWLRQDFLDESHHVSQEIDTPDGSYWHGIMHRREGDFENSKYWFRRVGHHPIFADLASATRTWANQADAGRQAEYFRTQTTWDPCSFVDLCQSAANHDAMEALAKKIQNREWELLFDHCYHQAVGDA